eukprot:CAMPEP_0194144908 /NCGR_PEP_ID=MMETSP0152-20130528/13885_1 /TAXON_ID=1049557 /ORGANISM="Thalassiothrix antarctica, Strain L6-D1" /LENGTH=140 /DNA_ID=CAMNT_0038844925 /DNA_START=89 /DNA_END=511 /DNA_ORIENTATION=+
MISRTSAFLLFSAFFVSTINAEECPEIPEAGCSICGEGKCINQEKKDVVFSFPSQPAVPCGMLQAAGLMGTIPLDQCGFLPGLVTVNCECQGPEDEVPVVSAPRDEVTSMSVSSANNLRSSIVSATTGAALLAVGGMYLN